jgi:hypothetical protein
MVSENNDCIGGLAHIVSWVGGGDMDLVGLLTGLFRKYRLFLLSRNY